MSNTTNAINGEQELNSLNKYLKPFGVSVVYQGCMIWLTPTKSECITATVVRVMSQKGYELNSFSEYDGKLYAFFHPKEGIRWE